VPIDVGLALVRAMLRDSGAWCRLEAEGAFAVHVGWDQYEYVGSPRTPGRLALRRRPRPAGCAAPGGRRVLGAPALRRRPPPRHVPGGDPRRERVAPAPPDRRHPRRRTLPADPARAAGGLGVPAHRGGDGHGRTARRRGGGDRVGAGGRRTTPGTQAAPGA
jgi:hypothetical protein